jgi:predicted MFS family arabinose efflux permease
LTRDPLVRHWVPASALSEAAYQALFVAIPVLTITRYHADAAAAGTAMGAFGAGAVIGSMSAAALAARLPVLGLALRGKVAQAVVFLALIAPLPVWAACVTMAALGLANGMTNGPAAATQIPRLDPRHRSNALTASFTITMGGGAIGSALAGPGLEHAGATWVFAIAAGLVSVSAALYLKGGRPARSARSGAPANASVEPVTSRRQ